MKLKVNSSEVSNVELKSPFNKSFVSVKKTNINVSVKNANNLNINEANSYRPSYFTNDHMTPDIFDFVHFSFCYFMLTAFLLFLWLIFTFDLCTSKVETKEILRETRGFSRAQTGDLVTAVIPLTWSLSMIIHAGSNSSNFDENTDNCVMTLNVIAYQWGWDYFIPLDVLVKLSDNDNYGNLLKTKSSNPTVFSDLFKNSFGNGQLDYLFDKSFSIGDADLLNTVNSGYTFSDFFLKNICEDDILVNMCCVEFFKTIVRTNLSGNLGCSYKLVYPSNLKDLDDDFFRSNSSYEFISTRTIISDSFGKKDNNFLDIVDHRYVINSGIVLPTNTPIHVICGSKDVIHSWAIPGLLTKIDCIPGYNSHRRLFIKWQGLFWGQCMEVCGRYHHWMPILIRTTHYDLFIVWLKSVSGSF